MKLRDWTEALAKVEWQGRCRVCRATPGRGVKLEAAHVLGRVHDETVVDARDVVPLCSSCHGAYDRRRLDLLPYLTLDEQARAVELVGIERARRRVTGGRA